MPRYDWISFTTDYGLDDGFVAVCHGVLAQTAPHARVLDVTHLVPLGDVRRGAQVLAQTVCHLPPAVHLAVVDPGVGTARRAIAVRAGHGLLVGPDNGLLVQAAQALGGVRSAAVLDQPDLHRHPVSATFHGRDIFAPVAAHLATGMPLEQVGSPVDVADLVRLPEPVVRRGDGWLAAEVLSVDRFGNLQLAAAGDELADAGPAVRISAVPASQSHLVTQAGEATPARRGTTFGAVEVGGLVVYTDSAGLLAVAVNSGSAARRLGAAGGDLVRVDWS